MLKAIIQKLKCYFGKHTYVNVRIQVCAEQHETPYKWCKGCWKPLFDYEDFPPYRGIKKN